ncbi:uncharacterized protein DUF4398 [Rivibacter subsaxonicus]|uniref:Uncharacterized protein DUF4398 n=2 Tax=Rivibacter subsaxonicus TaxID=457575 RepID=A0A4Q7W2E1_9BURK|nr:uncharacterized protein DUF4398 [Rivibacter subsaxonicus]
MPVLVSGVSILAIACASTPAPTEHVAVASSAVSRAVSAGGNEAAPAEMRTARDKLDRAKLAMAAKEYDQARVLAQEAQVDARLAEAKATSSKASKAADEVRQASRALSEEIDRKKQ